MQIGDSSCGDNLGWSSGMSGWMTSVSHDRCYFVSARDNTTNVT